MSPCGKENVMSYVGLVLSHVSSPPPIRRARSPYSKHNAKNIWQFLRQELEGSYQKSGK